MDSHAALRVSVGDVRSRNCIYMVLVWHLFVSRLKEYEN